MSDTSNLYNDMRNLIHFLPFICSGYPWRAIGNTLTVLQHRKYPIIHSLRSENVATDSKNKETIASLFFSRCQRSKVIFRVTRNHLALRGCDLAAYKFGVPWISLPLQNPFPLVSYFEVTSQPDISAPDGCRIVSLCGKPALHLPMVASVSSCTGVSLRPKVFHNLKPECYGK